MIRLRKYLERKNLWSDEKQKAAEEKAKIFVADVVKAAETIEKPLISDIFDYTFAEIPEELERQKRTMRTSSLGQDPTQAGLAAEPTAY